MYNLIEERWIPIRRESGVICRIAPWEIVDLDDPPIEVCSVRPDFNSALTQYLIALFQTVMMPEDDVEWLELLESPPSLDALHEKVASVSDAFELFSSGNMYMQDRSVCDSESKPIMNLLITTPGGNTIALNKDFFTKREDCIGSLCASCAATALSEMQFIAPVGGKGLRSSIRGSSAITTVVCGRNLWETVWLNVLSPVDMRKVGGDNPDASPFPWMWGEGPGVIVPEGRSPATVYWAMVRRILFDEPFFGECALCGSKGMCVSHYRELNYGSTHPSWMHPLCPIREKDGDFIPVPMSSRARNFDQWVAMAYERVESDRHPSLTVGRAMINRTDIKDIIGDRYRLWICGYDNKQALPLSWIDMKVPVCVNIPGSIDQFEGFVADLLSISRIVLKQLNSSLSYILNKGSKKDIPGYNKSSLDNRFWTKCNSKFVEMLNQYNPDNYLESIEGWMSSSREDAIEIFEELTDCIPLEDYEQLIKAKQKLIVVTAKKKLMKGLRNNE